MDRKAIFDAVWRMLGRGFTRAEVASLDQAINLALDSGPCGPQRIGPAGIALIKQFEGCARKRPDGRFEAYPDPGTGGDPWTIGWGATGACHVTGGRIAPGTIWTQAECDARLETDLARYAADVARALGDCPTSQHQFDALVSFHYNTGAIARATLTKLHKAGDHAGAAAEFGKWVNAGGRRLAGLVRRREAEAALYHRRG
ncbi:lysozyme [Novosphingobium sp.]|uniref:lysozyme n=1 Tax=Novosphingobium sp. TaxID=1874826 RepID=UPI0022BC9FCF|nr:lysozyme [Novosphingobium sp.]MCZ8019272.1 lysozyme [Novosphingobium sp.]MCZ8035087.1 lysozyme [Novosphingobium sp.]MCZ8050401.1 lysozyme [Novosphingobium sp.]MCZ8058747.1 lysozyme [Novosphingobium sp.]MCZ8232192.1 lysozyme [Novosphingobium sp.]